MAEVFEQFTLLLVDDNPVNLTLLVKIIELDLPEVRVLTASNARDGLTLIEQEQVDGAFIDVQMPQMSGLDMCRELKAHPDTAGILLVLITAHLASPQMRAEGLEVGAYDFISQPISNLEMLARIKVMLRLCQGERRLRSDQRVAAPATPELSSQLRWLSGLLLAGEPAETTPDSGLLASLAAELPNPAEMDELALISQLGSKFPLPWRRTFARLALLDSIPLSLARRLSELSDIEAVFEYLQRHDLGFMPTVAGAERFCFKPEVRQLLRERIGLTLDFAEQQRICQSAADWYQQKDQLNAALECLLRSQQYPAISQLLSQAGLGLLADRHQPQGMQLLAQVPEEQAAGCGWLALYTGIGCMCPRPLEVDSWLELARTRFVSTGDQRGELLALSQQLVQYLAVDGQQELGLPRLVRLRQLAEQNLELFDPFNRLKVLHAQGLAELFYAGSLVGCEEVLSRSMSEALREKLGEQQLDFHLLQVLLALFRGRFRVARAAMEQARLAASRLDGELFSAKAMRIVACELLFCSGDLQSFYPQRHLAQILWGREGLQQSALGPLLNFFAISGRVAQGDLAAARELLELSMVQSPAAARMHLRSWLVQSRGLVNAQTGRVAEAQADLALGLTLRQQLGDGLSSLPNYLLAGATAVVLQDDEQAMELLQRGMRVSIELKEERYRSGFHAWLAMLYSGRNEATLALAQLEELFALLRRQQVDFFFALTPELLRALVPLVNNRPDWSAQLQRLTRRWLNCAVAADGRLIPLARLQTLGGFAFELAGQRFDLNEVGQTSRQLLALLAVAPNASMSCELLMGALWPESSAAKARNSFDTALSRLRKVLEGCFGPQIRQDYLVLERGMLLLRNLRIDSVQFTRTMETARRCMARQNLWQAELALSRAESLWQGEFLVGYDLESELPERRDQLNLLRLEQVQGLARRLQLRGDSCAAIRLLQAGLRLDPTHDVLIQQLLEIYQQQGEVRAVRQLLDSYRSALQQEDYDTDEIEELIMTLGPQRLDL